MVRKKEVLSERDTLVQKNQFLKAEVAELKADLTATHRELLAEQARVSARIKDVPFQDLLTVMKAQIDEQIQDETNAHKQWSLTMIKKALKTL